MIFPICRSEAVVKTKVAADAVLGSVAATVMVTAETCPPKGPDEINLLTWSTVDSTDTSTAPPVLVPDAMFANVQVFAVLSHAFVVLSTNCVAGFARAATVAVGVVAPPLQTTVGTPAAFATKNPDGNLMVMALAVPATVGKADVVKVTATALPPGAAAAATFGTA